MKNTFSEPKGTSSNCFSCPTNKETSFKNINDKKQQILSFTLEPCLIISYITCI